MKWGFPIPFPSSSLRTRLSVQKGRVWAMACASKYTWSMVGQFAISGNITITTPYEDLLEEWLIAGWRKIFIYLHLSPSSTLGQIQRSIEICLIQLVVTLTSHFQDIICNQQIRLVTPGAQYGALITPAFWHGDNLNVSVCQEGVSCVYCKHHTSIVQGDRDLLVGEVAGA